MEPGFIPDHPCRVNPGGLLLDMDNTNAIDRLTDVVRDLAERHQALTDAVATAGELLSAAHQRINKQERRIKMLERAPRWDHPDFGDTP